MKSNRWLNVEILSKFSRVEDDISRTRPLGQILVLQMTSLMKDFVGEILNGEE